jgi:hypothetical protein
VEGTAPPDRNDEYLLYQLLLGAWPAELTEAPLDPEAVRDFAERIEGAMRKSVREAKLHSSWAAPNTAYEDALLGFVRDALTLDASAAFLDAFLPFQARVARLGPREQPGAGGAEADPARHARHLPGRGALGPQPGGPGQPAPGGFRAAGAAAGGGLGGHGARPLAAVRDMLGTWRDGRLKLAVTARCSRCGGGIRCCSRRAATRRCRPPATLPTGSAPSPELRGGELVVVARRFPRGSGTARGAAAAAALAAWPGGTC